MISQADLVRIVAAYGGEYDRLQRDLNRQVGLIWQELGGASETQRREWLAVIVPLVTGAEQQSWSLYAGFSALLGSALGIRPRPQRRPTDLVGRGVPTSAVAERPIITMRRLLMEGRNPNEAQRIAGERARTSLGANVVLAHRNAADAGLKSLGVQRYRRVLTSDSCPLCVAASKQTYATGDLMPIHPNCDCRVVPVLPGDPAAAMNSRIDTQPSGDVRVEMHGELGSVLTDSAHQFTALDG